MKFAMKFVYKNKWKPLPWRASAWKRKGGGGGREKNSRGYNLGIIISIFN